MAQWRVGRVGFGVRCRKGWGYEGCGQRAVAALEGVERVRARGVRVVRVFCDRSMRVARTVGEEDPGRWGRAAEREERETR